jgi:hypothetical protein
MSYRRLRNRNRLDRRVPLEADPYSGPLEPYVQTWLDEHPDWWKSREEVPSYVMDEQSRHMIRGELNRFERDILGLSCWCPSGNGWTRHGDDPCPSNRYASEVAERAGVTPEQVRAVMRAVMESP